VRSCLRCDLSLPTFWRRIFHDSPFASFENTCYAAWSARRIAFLQEQIEDTAKRKAEWDEIAKGYDGVVQAWDHYLSAPASSPSPPPPADG
jgi:hypothetical protein